MYCTLYVLMPITFTYTVTVKEVDKKIRNLRTQYTREKAKSKKRKSGDGAEDTYISKWMYYRQFSFLDDFVTARSSRCNLQVITICMLSGVGLS